VASRALKQSSVKRVQYLMREERLNTADSAMNREVHIPVQVYIARKGRPGGGDWGDEREEGWDER
jgi:hypothetical protein